MKAGSYATLTINCGVVEKSIDIDKMSYAQNTFLRHCFNNEFKLQTINNYYNFLKKSQIDVVKTDCYINENVIKLKQPIIEGLSLDYFIKERSINFDRKSFHECLELIKKATKILVYSHKTQPFYVDCNLMNFIVNGDKLTLVDVFPPLIKNNLKDIKNSPVQEQVNLFIDPKIQFISMISYFLKPFFQDIDNKFLSEIDKKKMAYSLIANTLKQLQPLTKDLFDIIEVIKNIDENSQHTFQKRFYEIKKYFKSKNISFEEFNNNFSKYSLKKVLDGLKENEKTYECCLHQDIMDINIKAYDKKLLSNLFYYFKYNAEFNKKSENPVFSIEIEKKSNQSKEFLNKCFKTQETSLEPFTYIYIDNKTKTIKIFLDENNKNNEIVVRRNIYNIYSRIMEESGYFTLHASCVEKNGKCFAIVGRKNAGKSVTMLNFLRKGYSLVSNDRLFIRAEKEKLVAIGHPLSIGVRVTKKWFEDEQNAVLAEYIKNSGFQFSFELGDSDKNKFYFTPKALTNLLNVDLKSEEYLSGIIIPSYVPDKENFEMKDVSKQEIKELVLDQNIPAIHETKIFLENIVINDKIIKDSKYDIAKKLANLGAVNICQNEKTTKNFFSFAENISQE